MEKQEAKNGKNKKIVISKKSKDDNFVDITVELLNLIYNNHSTDNKREASVNLKNLISKDISIFMVYINKYLQNPSNAITCAVINDEISRESEFAAFKRQIIKDNKELFEAFKEAL
jgi:hypothetical protein